MSRSISLFFSSRTSENARTFTRAISKTRDKISFLIQNRRQKFCPKDCLFCSKKNKKFRSFDQKKFKKTANEFFLQQTEERKQRKNSKKKKSVGKELDTSLCCAIDLVTALT